MNQEIAPIQVRPWTLNGMSERLIVSSLSRVIVILLAFVAAGCGTPTTAEYPVVSGRRVQNTTLAADAGVPYRVGAYELVFAPGPGAARHARRAALLVDLAGGQGHARGFMEWGRSGEVPVVYVAVGWARQRDVAGEPQTVFELALEHIDVRRSPSIAPDPPSPAPLAVRVVVHEASGAVTLTRRR